MMAGAEMGNVVSFIDKDTRELRSEAERLYDEIARVVADRHAQAAIYALVGILKVLLVALPVSGRQAVIDTIETGLREIRYEEGNHDPEH
jgi:hypothetical protein